VFLQPTRQQVFLAEVTHQQLFRRAYYYTYYELELREYYYDTACAKTHVVDGNRLNGGSVGPTEFSLIDLIQSVLLADISE